MHITKTVATLLSLISFMNMAVFGTGESDS